MEDRLSGWHAPVPSSESSAVEQDYLAKWISPVAIFPCAASRDEASEASERLLADAFANGGWERVTRLYRNQDMAEESCWIRCAGWCLAYG